jgi:hypothetical protein
MNQLPKLSKECQINEYLKRRNYEIQMFFLYQQVWQKPQQENKNNA